MALPVLPSMPYTGQSFGPSDSRELSAVAERLAFHIRDVCAKPGGRFVLFGDFDADGMTSTAVAYLFARLFGLPLESVFPSISNRSDDYGLSESSLKRIRSQHPIGEGSGCLPAGSVLVLFMDMGVNSHKEALSLASEGYRVVVLDHHVPVPGASEAWFQVEKATDGMASAYDAYFHMFGHQSGSRLADSGASSEEVDARNSPLVTLSAAGIVYLTFLEILEGNLAGLSQPIFDAGLDGWRVAVNPDEPRRQFSMDRVLSTIEKIAAISQASDCMPFAKNGELTKAWQLASAFSLPSPLLPGVALLASQTATASRIGWVVGPLLNAAGRIGDPMKAFELLVEVDEGRAQERLATLQDDRAVVREETRRAAVDVSRSSLTETGLRINVSLPEVDSMEGFVDLCRLAASGDQESKNKVDSLLSQCTPPGVVGIAAARVGEATKAPSFFMTTVLDKKTGLPVLKGSMRSSQTTFSCEKFINKAIEKGVILKGGGHAHAGGAVMPFTEDAVGRLCELAELETFESEEPPVCDVTVGESKIYQRQVESLLPFGKGHESAILRIHGEICGLRALGASRWAYLVTMMDPSDGSTVEVKITTRDLDRESQDLIDELALKGFAPFGGSLDVRLHDGLKFKAGGTEALDLTWGRTDYRVVAVADSGSSAETESGRRAAVNGLLSGLQAAKKLGGNRANFRVAKTLPVSGAILPKNLYSLSAPSPWELPAIVGQEDSDTILKSIGGKWLPREKVRVVSKHVVEKLRRHQNPAVRTVISHDAIAALSFEEAEIEAIRANKRNLTTFEIPWLKEGGKKPYGFQYADVRLYLSKPIILSNNDQGSGKSIEGGMWAALRVFGAKVTASGDVHFDTDRQGRCALVVTKKGIAGQWCEEFNADFTIGSALVTTETLGEKNSDVSFDLSGDEETKGKSKKVTQKKTPGDATASRLAIVNRLREKNAVIVTTYSCIERNPWILQMSWAGIVLDEAHELKNPNSSRTKKFFGDEIDLAVTGSTPLLPMSGTFAKNRPVDWFVWMRITGADGALYTSGSLKNALNEFQKRFNGMTWEQMKLRGRTIAKAVFGEPENGDELRSIMEPFVVRRLKSEIADIPPLDFRLCRVSSSGVFQAAIEMIQKGTSSKDGGVDVLRKYGFIGGSGFVSDSGLVAPEDKAALFAGDDDSDESESKSVAASLKKKVANTPESGAIARLDSIEALATRVASITALDKAAGIISTLDDMGWTAPASAERNGANRRVAAEPFVILTTHVAAAKEIDERLRAAGLSTFLMLQKHSPDERRDMARRFNLRGERDAFVTTFGVGGEGISLHKRSRRILLAGIPWVEAALVQGRDRVHRLGQTKPVECVMLVLGGSLDEGIWATMRLKGRANVKTLANDRLKEGELPGWVFGHLDEELKAKSIDTKSQNGKLTRRPAQVSAAEPSQPLPQAQKKTRSLPGL